MNDAENFVARIAVILHIIGRFARPHAAMPFAVLGSVRAGFFWLRATRALPALTCTSIRLTIAFFDRSTPLRAGIGLLTTPRIALRSVCRPARFPSPRIRVCVTDPARVFVLGVDFYEIVENFVSNRVPNLMNLNK